MEELIEDTMLTADKVTMADLLSLGTKHLDKECESVEALRDHLIELVSVRNLRHRQGAEDGLRFVWRASFYGTQWQQHPVPCHLQLAGH